MKEKEIYEKHGESLVDLVEAMQRDGVKPAMAMALLLDKSIELAFHVTGNEADARKAIKLMTDEKAIEYSNNERN